MTIHNVLTAAGFKEVPAHRRAFAVYQPQSPAELEARAATHLAAFPCQLRGTRLRIEDRRGGCAVMESPIYACQKFGECSLWRYCKTQPHETCSGCESRDTSGDF